MTSFMRISQKLVFNQSKCICTIKRILSTTAVYVSLSSFMYLCIPCYCDACLNSSALRVGVKTLLNTIQPAYTSPNKDKVLKAGTIRITVRKLVTSLKHLQLLLNISQAA